MKTLPISEDLLLKIWLVFLNMEPSREYLDDECLEAKVFDEFKATFPDLMEKDP